MRAKGFRLLKMALLPLIMIALCACARAKLPEVKRAVDVAPAAVVTSSKTTKTAAPSAPDTVNPTALPKSPPPTEVPASPVMPSDEDDVDFVWIAQNGKRYHSRDNCGTMNPQIAEKILLTEALAGNYEPCRNCFGDADKKDDQP